MKSFEQEIRSRVQIQALKAILVAAFVIVALIIKSQLHGNLETVDKIIFMGLFVGGEVSAIRAILKYRRALKSPDALEEWHIKEADERNRIIKLKTSRSTLNLTCTLLSFAAVIASFFSQAVLLTIAIILIAILAMYRLLALYYSRKN